MGERNQLPPTRTPEQRKEAMARAIHTRRERAAFKAACKAGNIPPETAIEAPIAAKLKVEEFARSFPGIGPVTAQKIVEACHIRDGRRVRPGLHAGAAPRRGHQGAHDQGGRAVSINRVCISGNLTRDPELRATAGGTQVLSFGVAVNDRRRNAQTGEWEDYPNFVDCTMFGNRAEAVGRFLAKGMKVAIEGKLRYSSWERDGQKRSKLEVIVDEIELMVRREGQTQARPQQSLANTVPVQPQVQAAPQWSAQQAYAAVPQSEFYDEDVPF